ncbi:MAG: hypothetical protein HYW45_00255 [Candidatus Daviesbacteria bacterium]|nr:MAG: hypothetical protein HYW45_00255 [Candidatus Daviesbacteria bacterium]
MDKENPETVLYHISATEVVSGSGRGIKSWSHFGEGSTPEEALAKAEGRAQRLIEAGKAGGKNYDFVLGTIQVSPLPKKVRPENLVDTNTGEKYDQQS